MLRKTLSVLLLCSVLMLGLVPVMTPAQAAVAVVADPANMFHWAAEFAKWTNQASQMVQQYNQLVREYQWAQNIATRIQNGDMLTLLALVTTVSSQDLTRIDSYADMQKMLEGTISYSTQLGGMYHSVYGQALSMGQLSPSSPQDWGQAANRAIAFSQHADAAVLETLAVVANTNNATQQVKPKYDSLMLSIKAPNVLPEQTAQHAALASLYAAQAIDRNNQLLAAQAAMQAQQQAQLTAEQKQAIQAQYTEQQYWTASGQSLAGELQHVQSWEMQ